MLHGQSHQHMPWPSQKAPTKGSFQQQGTRHILSRPCSTPGANKIGGAGTVHALQRPACKLASCAKNSGGGAWGGRGGFCLLIPLPPAPSCFSQAVPLDNPSLSLRYERQSTCSGDVWSFSLALARHGCRCTGAFGHPWYQSNRAVCCILQSSG